jgi:hypothetical protein
MLLPMMSIAVEAPVSPLRLAAKPMIQPSSFVCRAFRSILEIRETRFIASS